MSKTILVTGGTGLLGSYLLRYLVRNGQQQIRAIKRKNSSMDLVKDVEKKIEWIDCDILDVPLLEDVMRGVQQVYHCAGMVSYQGKDKKLMYQVNVEGTANIVNLGLEEGIEKLIHVSSVAAIGRRKGLKESSEKTKWEKSEMNSQYGISKYQGEQEVWRGIAEGLNAVIINPSIIMGSGFWDKGSAKFFRTISKGYPFYASGGSGFVDVRDVCRMMIEMMEGDVVAQRFIANAENISYKNAFDIIAKSINRKPPSMPLNKFLGSLAWRAEWMRSKLTGGWAVITKETVANSFHTHIYLNQKSVDTFGFEYTSYEQTVVEVGRQFLEAEKNGMSPRVLPLI